MKRSNGGGEADEKMGSQTRKGQLNTGQKGEEQPQSYSRAPTTDNFNPF